MIFIRRSYSPTNDGDLAMYLDATDSSFSSLAAPGEIAISNGSDVLHWKNVKGAARSFDRYGSNSYPTWSSTGINSKGAVLCNGKILVANTVADLMGLSGITFSVAQQRIGNGAVPGDEGAFNLTATAGGLGNALAEVYIGSEATHTSGGRRVGTDTYAGVTGDAVTNGVPYLSTVVYDWAGGTVTLYQNAVLKGTASLASSGTMTLPYAMSVGGRANSGLITVGSAANCYVQTVMMFLKTVSLNDLYPRMRWQMSLMGI